MEVVDLGQRGEGDGVTAVLDAVGFLDLHLPFFHVSPTLLYFGKSSCGQRQSLINTIHSYIHTHLHIYIPTYMRTHPSDIAKYYTGTWVLAVLV